MRATELLTELVRRGVELIREPDGAHLRYRAPKGSLTPELRKSLVTHKVEVLALLAPTPPKPESCEHLSDPELADWYRRNPHLACARCWLAGPKSLWLQ